MNKLIAILLTILIIITSCILYKLCNPTINILEKTSNIDQGTDLLAADITADWDLDKVNIIEDTEGVKVPVPKGFSASKIEGEETVRTGFVIYETEEVVNEENKDEIQRTVNQFVWVQVADVNEMYGCDIDGIAHGKLYDVNSSGRNPLNWNEDSNGIMTIGNTSSYNEPVKQTLSSTEIPKYLSEEALAYNKDFRNMISSVKQYGGFYIGRYETGNLSTIRPKVVRGNTDINHQTWNTMKTRCENISNNQNVKTMMIFGCQWDATLEWLAKTGAKTYASICSSSSGGNFTMSSRPTGDYEGWKVNNIYDLSGNMWDWTQEVYNSSYAACRGGRYNVTRAVSDRGHEKFSNSDWYVGCRSALYIIPNI